MKDSQTRRLLEQGRKNQNQGGAVGAHLDASGLATPLSGDSEAPFVKANPFVTDSESYWLNAELDAAGTLTGAPIDVRAWRTLVVFLQTDQTIELRPYAAPDLTGNSNFIDDILHPDVTPFVPIVVIDPTLTVAAPLASRTLYQTSLVTPAGAFAGALAFDVSMYAAFRLLAVGTGDNAVVSLNYTLSM